MKKLSSIFIAFAVFCFIVFASCQGSGKTEEASEETTEEVMEEATEEVMDTVVAEEAETSEAEAEAAE